MKHLMTALMLAAGLAGTAQEAVNLSLKEAQELAMKNAFSMQYALLDQQVAERDVKELTATGLPQLSLEADYSNFIDLPTQVVPADAFGFPDYLTEFLGGVAVATGVPLNAPAPDGDGLSELQFGNQHTANVGVQASQLVFSGSYFVGLQAARLYADSRSQAIERTADEVRKAVADAYVTVLGAEANVAVLEEALEVVRESRTEMEAMLGAGFVDAMMVDQIALAVMDLEQDLAYAQTQAQLTRSLLRFQIGLNPATPIVLKDGFDDLLAAESGTDLLSRSFQPSALPGLQEQQAYVGLAELDVKNQRAAALPTIAAFYTFQKNAQRPEFNLFQSDQSWYNVQLAGLNFSMPLWTSLGGQQRVEKARLELVRAETGYRQMEAAAQLEFEAARAEFADAKSRVNNRTRAVELAQSIYNRTERGVNAGMNSSFELNDARSKLLEAQGGLIGAQMALLNAQSRLQSALSEFE